MIGLVVGGVIGWLRPDWGNAVYFLRDIFINLIKSIIAPLVFSTIVVGIAGAGALRKVGRMGIKALIYFEIVTTAALFIGLAVVNLTKPGVGVKLEATNTSAIQSIEHTHPQSFVETIVHAFPSSVTSWNLAFLHEETGSHQRSVIGHGPVHAVMASDSPSATDSHAGSADTSPRPVTVTGVPPLSVTTAASGVG